MAAAIADVAVACNHVEGYIHPVKHGPDLRQIRDAPVIDKPDADAQFRAEPPQTVESRAEGRNCLLEQNDIRMVDDNGNGKLAITVQPEIVRRGFYALTYHGLKNSQ
ncbi:hypothetical protein [Burkholderia cenocepacia]|uniref:hypothetical protein n=1 Tax=Burkholderia cenocepacia TaxID=95486 RepID=UPI00097BC37C|nr:hypothetical protein [Burkholderia cenocepacia]ONJ09655.1 hypothetical protein A8F33_09995 [Burkholderia cenocepacia]